MLKVHLKRQQYSHLFANVDHNRNTSEFSRCNSTGTCMNYWDYVHDRRDLRSVSKTMMQKTEILLP